jgi:Tfp pilus assembly protein PilX
MKSLNSRSERMLFKLLLQLQRKPQQESGYIIVVVMGMVLALSTMLITAALTSKVDTNNSRASGNSAAGFYAAEAGLNLRAKDIRDTFVGYNVPGHNGVDLSPNDSAACRDTTGTPPVPNTANDGSGDFACDNSETFKGQSVSTFVQNSNKLDPITRKPIPTPITIDSGDFAGLNAQEYRYDVTSVAFDQENQPTASLQMRFKSRLVPLFQFAAFFNQDLDFFVPPSMTINGPIHSNGDIYLDASGTLDIFGAVTTAGRLFRGERLNSGGSTSCHGTVKVLDPKPSSTQQTLACGSSSSKKQYSTTDLASWDNNIRVGIPTLTLPAINSFDPSAGHEYWDSADLRIVLNLDNTTEKPISIEVKNANGTTSTTSSNLLNNICAPTKTNLSGTITADSTSITVASNPGFAATLPLQTPLQIESGGIIDNDANVITVSSSGTTLPITKKLGNALGTSAVVPSASAVVRKATVWTSDTFWNYREKVTPGTPTTSDAKKIRMLNVDVKGLMTCAKQLMTSDGSKDLNDSTDGGLVWYLTVKGPKSTNDVNSSGISPAVPNTPNTYGIRLYNGSELAGGSGSETVQGLSIVSDQAIYIQGDYNTVNKKPAAIMADTINVLSNNWRLDDSASRVYASGVQGAETDVTNRTTLDTTINAAFLSGIDLTGGGLNNYPRFHENWQAKSSGSGSATLTYRGSMVSLGLPKRVNGPYCGSDSTNALCNIYNPPTRNWDYDTAFDNAATLPPLTPRFVYLRQERFSRDFNRRASLPLPYSLAKLLPLNFASIMPTVQTVSFRF